MGFLPGEGRDDPSDLPQTSCQEKSECKEWERDFRFGWSENTSGEYGDSPSLLYAADTGG